MTAGGRGDSPGGGGGEKMFSNQTVLTTAQLCEHTKPTE